MTNLEQIAKRYMRGVITWEEAVSMAKEIDYSEDDLAVTVCRLQKKSC